MKLEQSRLRAGIWEGVLFVDEAPSLQASHLGETLEGLSVEKKDDRRWKVSVPIAQERFSEGVQSFLMRDLASGDTVGELTVIAGVAADEDVRAEIDLLRAELDLLKKAFRSHCRDTVGQ